MKKCLYRDRNWLYQKYRKEELSTVKIARICGVDRKTIRTWMNRFDLPRRNKSEAQLIRTNDPEERKKISSVLKKFYQKPFKYTLYRKYFKNSLWYCAYRALKCWLDGIN